MIYKPSYYEESSKALTGLEGYSHIAIDLRAITANYKIIQSLTSPNVLCGAAIKANAYGLGLEKIAETLMKSGCNDFFVANLQEGIAWYRAVNNFINCISPNATGNFLSNNIYPRCYVLHGPRSAKEVELAEEHGLVLVINSKEQLDIYLERTKYLSPIVIHIDTGINRLGMSLEDFKSSITNLKKCNVLYLMSHLHSSEDEGAIQNQEQRLGLIEASKHLPEARLCLASSGGIFLGKPYHFDMVRPGLALYGGNPLPTRHNIMQAVVTLRCKVLQKKVINNHGTVGYGGSYVVTRGSKLLIVEYGYADGLPRSLSNNGYVEVVISGNGICTVGNFERASFNVVRQRYKLPIAGKISMDLCTIDATSLPDELFNQVEYVEFVNDNLTIDDIAKDANTVAYEILIRLGNRYGRTYYDL